MRVRTVLDFTTYLLLRILLLPIAVMPITWIHKLGKGLGLMLFYVLTDFRKRTLSNLSLAHGIVKDEQHLMQLAKESFQNLAITTLEYGKLPFIRDINKLITCENPEKAQAIINEGKGLIFFVGHQANWELLFLSGTSFMPGVAIGRPIKNRFLYQYVVRMRERFGGLIIEPKKAAKEGLRALKKGKFLGIVGDQAFPSGTFSCPFLGVKAYTSTLPALLSYKTGAPMITASIVRKKGGYTMRFSEPIYPDKTKPMPMEVEEMMKQCLSILEVSIRKNPSQWLWQHNRWKQEQADITFYRYRKNPILVILPKGDFTKTLMLLKKIYPKAFLTVWAPENPNVAGFTYKSYKDESELFVNDYTFQLVFNFTSVEKLSSHFTKLSASSVIDEKMLQALDHRAPSTPRNKELLLAKLLTRKGSPEVLDAR